MPFYGPHSLRTREIISDKMKTYAKKHPNWNHIKETVEKQMIRPVLSPSEDLAYTLAVILGDGYVTQGKTNGRRVCLGTISKIFALNFSASLKNIGLHPCKTYIDRRKIYHAVAVSKNFVEWYKKLAWVDIEKIVSLYPKAFTKGFYESEGSIFMRKGTGRYDIHIANSNLKILQTISRFLSSQDIRNSIYKRGMTVNNLQMYTLRIYEDDVVRFLDLIKPCIKYLHNTTIVKDYV